ncbi:beta-glucuronidase [Paenibacillus sp. FSL R7-0273]|uniref:glycoside hydrolase family 2 protein n=1 Tax=Paenibacillus sp. FSL R7-0273 TaxID=1536772 RepID=UPI0004F74CD4|nr:glycoside hydrolase family 2 TIM barrel-domain containing protein [Paenibacillus sp. FSL R7-0273]AIQ45512.1 beta-glucuronidase [Paenibacillus sp. FSL R7-0273]OMF89112.1 beta-glucuronidase [Paenibacillus sp. FSL R7-0273]
MLRTFRQHNIRVTELLDGPWDFVKDPLNAGLEEKWFERFPHSPQTLYVPSCWNNELGMYEYEGVGWYRKKIVLGSEQHVRLIFHAVQGHSDVYLDGQHLGYHYGGFTPFEFLVPSLAAGEHELIIRTDSTLDRFTIPTEQVDWFHYGGIIRSVELQFLPDLYIEQLKIDYELQGAEAEVSVQVQLRSLLTDALATRLVLSEGGRELHAEDVQVEAGQVLNHVIKLRLKDVRLWNVGKPELYTFQLRTAHDDKLERIGFRTIETKDHRILINGAPVYLKGVNRHEEHPEWGFAFPPKLMHKELDIILELGCNTVRGSHYPQSSYWLDLLDENGLVFWSEIPIWGCFLPNETVSEPLFRDRALTMIEEMIGTHYHHPSVVFWSVHNEIDTRTQEAYAFTEALIGLVRKLDTSRLVTYATMHPLEDILLPLFDVIGINKYFGWYEGEVSGFKGMLEQFHKRAEQLGAGDTPVLMTEFGGAGLFGDAGWEPRLFSEDYQAHIVTEALNIFRADPKIGGTYIWQFADIRGDLKSSSRNFRDRARGFNNKGLVNEYRKPKQSFREVRRIYQSWTD